MMVFQAKLPSHCVFPSHIVWFPKYSCSHVHVLRVNVFWKNFLLEKAFTTIYRPISGLSCLLSYWERKNSPSKTYEVYLKETNKSKSTSFWVKNNLGKQYEKFP